MVHDDVGKMNDVWLRRFTFMTSSCLFSMPLREAEDNETKSPPSTVVCDLRAAGHRVVLGVDCTVTVLQRNGGSSSTESTKSVRLRSLLLLLLYMDVSCHRPFFLVLLLNQQWSPPLRLQLHTAILSLLCVMFQVQLSFVVKLVNAFQVSR